MNNEIFKIFLLKTTFFGFNSWFAQQFLNYIYLQFYKYNIFQSFRRMKRLQFHLIVLNFFNIFE